MNAPKLSVVVIAYNMTRELPRTLQTLSPACQCDIDADDYEVIVIDNGSTQAFDHDLCRRLCPNLDIHVVADAPPSPVEAINRGLALARGALVGVCIDGARMASPRLLATALEAARLHPRPVIGTLAFHLGPDVQSRSVANGYDQAAEDALLATVDWVADGYRLFSISALAGSSEEGWFTLPAETNAVFLTREHWQALGGYDPAFVAPGGGLANLDTWARACADPSGRAIVLLGEATFHQVHGGIATNAAVSKWPQFHDEYVRVRGAKYVRPAGSPLLYGRPHPEMLPSMQASVQRRQQREAATGTAMAAAMGTSRVPTQDAGAVDTVRGRAFASSLGSEVLDRIQAGTLRTVYRNVPFFKSPFDIALYLQLLSRLAPRTVIEIGSKFGGSALWFADMLSAQGIADATVLSVDIEPLARFTDPRITFLQGDALRLGEVLPPTLLQRCPRPLLVVEDSSHHYPEATAVLDYFHAHLQPGDYIVVEDGVVSQLSAPRYREYAHGPNRAVADFLARHVDAYAIDTTLCDQYGHNATYNPNGWLRRL